ncbi:hypothetical protein PABG_01919 [Paracoccidioides brasiliensis Pb03]|nr:hypothetical protein PABG_01919 [Paracoccidioides brasiliensis Pb03]
MGVTYRRKSGVPTPRKTIANKTRDMPFPSANIAATPNLPLANTVFELIRNTNALSSANSHGLSAPGAIVTPSPMMDVIRIQPTKVSLPQKPPTHTRKKDRSDAFRECVICAELKPLGWKGANFPSFPRCAHGPQTCSDCVSKHIIITLKTRAPINHIQVASKGVIDWSICTCPQCNMTLTESEIRSALSRSENAVITGIASRKELESHPRWASCLSITCSSGQIFPEGAQSEKVVCIKCGASSCFLHGIPWHTKYTCGQYDDSHPNAQSVRSSEDRIKKMTKKCPNPGCGWRIQKSGGCPNMLCIKCSRPFRWDEVKWDENVVPEPE